MRHDLIFFALGAGAMIVLYELRNRIRQWVGRGVEDAGSAIEGKPKPN